MKITACFLGVLLVVGSTATPCLATDFETERARGVVGERADGLVAPIKKSAALSALVHSINAARMAELRQQSDRSGASLATVRAIAGARHIAEARAHGWYWMDANGAWRKD